MRYKLVPVEPTPEMRRKAGLTRGADYYTITKVWRAMIDAAPAVQGEPVGRVKTVGGYPDESEHTIEWLCKYKELKDGDLLYTAPDVAQPVAVPEIIKAVANFVGSQKGGPFTPAVMKAAIISQLEYGNTFTKLYTAPQPTEQQPSSECLGVGCMDQGCPAHYADPEPDPDAAKLVEALVEMIDIAKSVDSWESFPSAPIERAEEALALYRKQRGDL